MRVIVAVTNDLVTDQRVARTCKTLHEAGYEVMLVGRRLAQSAPVARPYPVRRMRLLFTKGALFYAEYNLRLFLHLLFHRFDIVYANDTDTLMASFLAARLKGRRIVFDAHEMFPEVPELVGRPRVKHVWETIERLFMPRVDGAITVCQSIADLYREHLGVEMSVVRNVPDRDGATPLSIAKAAPPILLYQGAVNVGRGVDRMIEAMRWLTDYRLVVVGVGDEYEAMRELAASKPWSERIEFRGRMQPDELALLTPQATLGLCLLDNMGLNYYYSLPNRIGDFVWAGVPLLASRLPEIARVVEGYGVGYLVDDQQGEALAQCVRNAVEQWSSLSADEQNHRMATARNDLSWQHDSRKLLSVVEGATK